MKLFSRLAVVLGLGVSVVLAPASALAFPVPIQVLWTPAQAQVSVYNPEQDWISCVGRLSGLRQDGLYQFQDFALSMIAPGSYQYIFINNIGPYPFVGATAWVDCGWGAGF